MKKIMACVVVFVISITMILAKNPKPSSIGNRHHWVVVLTPETKKHYLDSLSTVWRKDSIYLNFSKLEYDTKGQLIKIKGSVNIHTTGGLPSGTFASDSLVSYEIKIDKPWRLMIKGK